MLWWGARLKLKSREVMHDALVRIQIGIKTAM